MLVFIDLVFIFIASYWNVYDSFTKKVAHIVGAPEIKDFLVSASTIYNFLLMFSFGALVIPVYLLFTGKITLGVILLVTALIFPKIASYIFNNPRFLAKRAISNLQKNKKSFFEKYGKNEEASALFNETESALENIAYTK